MGEEKIDYRQLRYAEYAKQRGELARSNVELSGRYDQWILTLSGGAVIASIAFLEKIAPHPSSNTVFLLGLAWLCLIVSLLSGFLSLLTAQYSAAHQIELLDADHAERDQIDQEVAEGKARRSISASENKYNRLTHALNIASPVGLTAGISLLCLFAYANISSVATMPVPIPSKIEVNVRFDNPMPPQTSITNVIKP
jgi:hypothetical protein